MSTVAGATRAGGAGRWAVAVALATVACAAPSSAAAATTSAEWHPACANRSATVGDLGLAKTESVLFCIFNQIRSHFFHTGAIKRNAYVRKAATRVLASGNFSIPHITSVLSQVGYFRHGGKGFMRCSPLRFTKERTPEEIALAIYNREGFILLPRMKDIGIVFRNGNTVFVLTGRR
jgi:hypothetical protein